MGRGNLLSWIVQLKCFVLRAQTSGVKIQNHTIGIRFCTNIFFLLQFFLKLSKLNKKEILHFLYVNAAN